MLATLQISKQINTLKLFDMEPRKAKKHFVSEEEINCEEELNLTPEDRIDNINWCKCGYECKPMAAFSEGFC